MSKTFNRFFFRFSACAVAAFVSGPICPLPLANVAAEPAPAAAAAPAANAPADRESSLLSALERQFLAPPVQVTIGMPKAGEGYFAPDARRICYQAVPADYPFYQIFVQPFDMAAPRPATPVRISTGRGRTTCSWFSPDGTRLLFASSHLDPHLDATESAARAQAEEDRKTGRRRRYQWDFDPHSDIFVVNLEPAAGEGSGLVQLTNEPGYDGGPFFSPDGRWIAYRTDRLEKDMLQIHVMKADGSGDVAITSGQGVRWAPYWHPTKPWLIWTGADHSDPTKRPNYDLWIAAYAVDAAAGATGFRCGPPLRITDHEGADVLPAFSPDGMLLMWTASRGDGGGRAPASQLWVSRFNAAAINAALEPVAGPREGASQP